jgi:hypothetical protein
LPYILLPSSLTDGQYGIGYVIKITGRPQRAVREVGVKLKSISAMQRILIKEPSPIFQNHD